MCRGPSGWCWCLSHPVPPVTPATVPSPGMHQSVLSGARSTGPAPSPLQPQATAVHGLPALVSLQPVHSVPCLRVPRGRSVAPPSPPLPSGPAEIRGPVLEPPSCPSPLPVPPRSANPLASQFLTVHLEQEAASMPCHQDEKLSSLCFHPFLLTSQRRPDSPSARMLASFPPRGPHPLLGVAASATTVLVAFAGVPRPPPLRPSSSASFL